MNRCPKCNSPKPHRHPAVQCEGEVHLCTHEFHLTPTPENTWIDDVLKKRATEALGQEPGR